MRHPFDGINSPPAEQPTRRSVLGKLLTAAAGLGGLLFGSKSRATAQIFTTQAVGEEGGRPPVTTQAVGEEGGRPPVTTRAVREEGVTTYVVGEEGGTTRVLREEGATTQAVGEEGGRQ